MMGAFLVRKYWNPMKGGHLSYSVDWGNEGIVGVCSFPHPAVEFEYLNLPYTG